MANSPYTTNLRHTDYYEVKLKTGCPLVEDNYVNYDNYVTACRDKRFEKVITPAEAGENMYLPHRAVLKEEKSTKLRIVLDASAKPPVSKYSLNDCLYTGPCLTPLLYELLIRFRIFNIAIVSDIEKAYLQISVAPEHRDFLRFLWFDDLNCSNPKVEKYRCKRLIYGAFCSQCLLNIFVRAHLTRYSENDPNFVTKLLKSFCG